MLHLDPFYPIVPDTDWLVRLLAQGIKLVQLRIKDQGAEFVRAEIDMAITLCAEHRCQLVINDYWHEAIDAGAALIHLGQEDLAAADLVAIRAAGIKIGISTHCDEELEKALSADADYVALGPIYTTKLKKMPWAPQGLARLTEWRARIKCPLVAIGGITPERAPVVLEAGADSAAVITDILTDQDPELRIRNWISVTKPWRHLSTEFPQS